LDDKSQAQGKTFKFGGPEVYNWLEFIEKAAAEYALYQGKIQVLPPALAQ